jgi:homogentisate 1,2-dioxygenase
LYYVDGDFMSLNNIEQGYIIRHSLIPAPGAMERSIGLETHELAVVMMTFSSGDQATEDWRLG